MLGIAPHEFPEYKIFARSVLKKCQTALKKNSDLMFDYKPIGRPAQAVRFMIYENTSFVLPDTLSTSNMIFQSQGIIEKSHTYSQYYQHPIPSWPVLSEQTDQMKLLFQINKQAFFEEFDYSTMEYLIEIIKKMYPLPQICNADFFADYLKQVIPDLRIFYLQMSRAAASPLMRARSNYLAKILLNECTSKLGFSYSNTSHKYTYKGSHDNRFGFERRDYDLSEIEHLLLM